MHATREICARTKIIESPPDGGLFVRGIVSWNIMGVGVELDYCRE